MSEVESNSESISKYPVGSALHHLESLLERRMRVKLSDGRVVEGDLQCLDKDMNLILNDAVEYHGLTEATGDVSVPDVVSSRNLGMAMLPGPHILSVHLKPKEE